MHFPEDSNKFSRKVDTVENKTMTFGMTQNTRFSKCVSIDPTNYRTNKQNLNFDIKHFDSNNSSTTQINLTSLEK